MKLSLLEPEFFFEMKCSAYFSIIPLSQTALYSESGFETNLFRKISNQGINLKPIG